MFPKLCLLSALAIIVVGGLAFPAVAQTTDECLECHDDADDLEVFEASIHGGFESLRRQRVGPDHDHKTIIGPCV